MSQLSKLFEPLQIGPMTVPNRIMMSAMSAGPKVDEKLEITDQIIAYYVERARTAPGMMAIGATAVVPNPLRRGIRLFDEEILPSLTRLVEAVHRYDTRFGAQLFNPGGTGGGPIELISPSGISSNVRDARESERSRLRNGHRVRSRQCQPGEIGRASCRERVFSSV